jgi:TonB family protein
MPATAVRWALVVAVLGACAAPPSRQAGLIPMPDNPAPAYPEVFRDSGVTGTVVVKMRVDRTGAVDPASLAVISESDPAFTAEVRRVIPLWRFRRTPGDSSEPVVEQRFAFKARQPTAVECRAVIARQDTLEADRTRELRVLHARLPARRGAAKTVAEFLVDTTGRPDVATLRIVQSSLSDRDARADLERVLPDWRFVPASTRGCVYPSKTRHEFSY